MTWRQRGISTLDMLPVLSPRAHCTTTPPSPTSGGAPDTSADTNVTSAAVLQDDCWSGDVTRAAWSRACWNLEADNFTDTWTAHFLSARWNLSTVLCAFSPFRVSFSPLPRLPRFPHANVHQWKGFMWHGDAHFDGTWTNWCWKCQPARAELCHGDRLICERGRSLHVLAGIWKHGSFRHGAKIISFTPCLPDRGETELAPVPAPQGLPRMGRNSPPRMALTHLPTPFCGCGLDIHSWTKEPARSYGGELDGSATC